MNPTNPSIHLFVSLFMLASNGAVARGEVFGTGGDTFEIEFVTIANPGNVADTTGDPNPAGSVPYTYRIGTYEISEQMVDKANTLGGLGLTIQGNGPDKPATLAWYDAAKFVNWLNTSKGHDAAYKFDSQGIFEAWQPDDPGYDPANLHRNTRATYVLPNVDEWYKAAYFDPATGDYFLYPTGSDVPPVAVESGTLSNTVVTFPAANKPADIMQAGGLSPYGTMAQGGNIYEWHETEADLMNDDGPGRIFRGGTWHSGTIAMQSSRRRVAAANYGDRSIGFRVVHIPEPASLLLFALGLVGPVEMERRIERQKKANRPE